MAEIWNTCLKVIESRFMQGVDDMYKPYKIACIMKFFLFTYNNLSIVQLYNGFSFVNQSDEKMKH